MQPMSSAPVDGQIIRLHMQDGSSFLARPIDGLLDASENDCWSWGTVNEDEGPEDWTDGICWDVNDAGARSTYPVGWSPDKEG